MIYIYIFFFFLSIAVVVNIFTAAAIIIIIIIIISHSSSSKFQPFCLYRIGCFVKTIMEVGVILLEFSQTTRIFFEVM